MNWQSDEITLPPSGTRRWTWTKKSALINAIILGQITELEAVYRYPDMSLGELDEWRALFVGHGATALKVTRLRSYR